MARATRFCGLARGRRKPRKCCDLAAAGIPYEDDKGHVYDFHSLRAQFISDLSRSGVSLVEAQKLARHSDPRLTSNHYTHLSVHDLSTAVEKLSPIEIIPASELATGTDDFSCTSVALVGDKTPDSMRAIDDKTSEKQPCPETLKPLQLQGFEDDCEPLRGMRAQGLEPWTYGLKVLLSALRNVRKPCDCRCFRVALTSL